MIEVKSPAEQVGDGKLHAKDARSCERKSGSVESVVNSLIARQLEAESRFIPFADVLADQLPVAQVGDEHEAILMPVFFNLRGFADVADWLGGGLDPDGGLYTEEQFDRKTLKLKDAQSPNRGVIEVKSPAEPVDDISKTTQIEKYWHQYRLVLVTNLRDWQLIGERDRVGQDAAFCREIDREPRSRY